MSFTLAAINGDLVISGGSLRRVSGADEVRQRILVTLQHERGEWFLNPEGGVPWEEEVLGTKNNVEAATLLVRDAIDQVPGVERVRDVVVTFDTSPRRLNIRAECEVRRGANDPAEAVTIETAIGL